jgi:putative addiction module component (TIGR02574 family)
VDPETEPAWQPELTEELKAELDRRIAACEAEPTNVVTWDQLAARIRRRRNPNQNSRESEQR